MKIIAFALAVIIAFASYANRPADSVKVSFRLGQSQFDPALGDNREAIDGFITLVKQADAENNIDSIVIKAYASPDGPSTVNALLSQQRCDVIADLIARRTGVNRALIYKMPEGIAWGELRRLVAETPDVPSRLKILDIIDNTPVFVYDAKGKAIDGRKKQLMDLDGGRTYKWLYANLFPLMRNAIAVALVKKRTAPDDLRETMTDPALEPDTAVTVTETLVETEPGDSVGLREQVISDFQGDEADSGEMMQ
ncbi:MAG: hypothetical protein K2G23_10000, partial [Muribaculaceae bacterium]|nr:hypothetical protein [Muribaculaceae bacterium]